MDDKIPDHAAAIDWLDAIGFAGNIQSGVLRIGFPKLSDGFCNLAENLARAYVALAAFKVYVHRRLDEAGIPTDPESPHKAAGCRIGGRLDIALALTATVAELQAKVGKLEAECRTGDKILEMFQRLIAIFPECPDHGGCVPFAESAIAALRAENAALKAQLTGAGFVPYLDRMREISKREEAVIAQRDALKERVVWQPIETAPEATYVLLRVPNYGIHVGTRTGRQWWAHELELVNPSHWMALPAEPNEARAIQQRREGKEKA
jgi:hypothetical protein